CNQEVEQSREYHIADNQSDACEIDAFQEFSPVHRKPCTKIRPCEICDELGDGEYEYDIAGHVLDRLCHIMRDILALFDPADRNTEGHADDDEEDQDDRHDPVKER